MTLSRVSCPIDRHPASQEGRRLWQWVSRGHDCCSAAQFLSNARLKLILGLKPRFSSRCPPPRFGAHRPTDRSSTLSEVCTPSCVKALDACPQQGRIGHDEPALERFTATDPAGASPKVRFSTRPCRSTVCSRMTHLGHEQRFPPRRLSGRCGIESGRWPSMSMLMSRRCRLLGQVLGGGSC